MIGFSSSAKHHGHIHGENCCPLGMHSIGVINFVLYRSVNGTSKASCISS
ncbi:hypothetical protein SCA6_011420 [Theobroma cacao]